MAKSILTSPPRGWNSWDCYGASVREDEVRSNAEYMSEKLKQYGWEYIVVDIQWYEPNASSNEYNDGAKLEMDEYSRLIPAVNRFPSAADGAGFRPLAEYIHSRGLKFGIHILRGIAKQAVRQNTAIEGSSAKAADIADTGSICEWNGDMYGVDMSKDGAQEYYDSLFRMYAEWGVDFVKVDDIARPYHEEEIEGIRKAIDKCGREMVLSLSPGAAPADKADHLAANANMWRMTDDFWDSWELLRDMLDYCRTWFVYVKDGAYPDCDMMPLGKIGIRSAGKPRMTNFSRDEQIFLMTLWCIFRSPLIFGGDLRYNDEFTLSLLTNEELLHINSYSYAGREVYRRGSAVVWAANGKKGVVYAAIFNTSEEEITENGPLEFISSQSATSAVEIWTGKTVRVNENTIAADVPPHGARLFRIETV